MLKLYMCTHYKAVPKSIADRMKKICKTESLYLGDYHFYKNIE